MSAIIDGNSQRMTVWLDGEIDHHNASGIRMRIDESIARIKPKVLRIDFSAVSFMVLFCRAEGRLVTGMAGRTGRMCSRFLPQRNGSGGVFYCAADLHAPSAGDFSAAEQPGDRAGLRDPVPDGHTLVHAVLL